MMAGTRPENTTTKIEAMLDAKLQNIGNIVKKRPRIYQFLLRELNILQPKQIISTNS